MLFVLLGVVAHFDDVDPGGLVESHGDRAGELRFAGDEFDAEAGGEGELFCGVGGLGGGDAGEFGGVVAVGRVLSLGLLTTILLRGRRGRGGLQGKSAEEQEEGREFGRGRHGGVPVGGPAILLERGGALEKRKVLVFPNLPRCQLARSR